MLGVQCADEGGQSSAQDCYLILLDLTLSTQNSGRHAVYYVRLPKGVWLGLL